MDWLENFEDVTGYKKNTDYVAITQKRVTAQVYLRYTLLQSWRRRT